METGGRGEGGGRMMNYERKDTRAILKQYSQSKGLPVRSTLDLGPLEEWLIRGLLRARRAAELARIKVRGERGY